MMIKFLKVLFLTFWCFEVVSGPHDETAQRASNMAFQNAEKYEQEVAKFLDEIANSGGHSKPQGSFFFNETGDEKLNVSRHDTQTSEVEVQSNIPLPSFKKKKSCDGKCATQSLQSLRSFKAMGPSQLLVFASFSMPDESLKALSRDAQKSGCRLIMRGLYENSFQKTQKKASALGIQYEIDPNLFEEFKVEVVPTFIHAHVEKGTLVSKEYDRLSGNISLYYALKELSQNGTIQGAGESLKKLQEKGRR